MIRVDDQEVQWFEGMTVTDLLKQIGYEGSCAVVRINETHVSRPTFDQTLVPDGAQVYLIPMIAGG
ncbi:MAG: sulfur carrier protein ThiS [Desulfohalobiaceae bacterium]|nr:sulfur carrier protein ThiS [Desulfohalobiaceae bacterium]